MAKRDAELDIRNPFIPSFSPVCRAADQVLIFSVVLVALLAVFAALFRQVSP